MSVYKDGKKWRVVYRYTDWQGETHQTQKRGFSTQREAKQWEAEQMLRTQQDIDMNFVSFVEIYTADLKKRVRENTWQTKEHIIRTKIVPYFEKRKISEIQPKDIIAYHVSSGTPMWQHAVRKGTVLYLALEDDYRRLQERMYRMFGTETTPDLFFSVASSSLGEGLLDQLGAFLAEHPDTSLVIIDTLQKVREAESDTYSYARDYDVIAALKAFSDQTGICLLLVHHTRKQKADDSFDRISGTNGLLGAADGAFIMYKSRRSDNEATIEISGRDQPDKRIQLTRNKQTLCWDFKSERAPAESELPEPVLEAVGRFIGPDNPVWEGKATELIEKLALDIKPNILTLKLNVNASKLYNHYFIQYCTGRSHQGRKIMLRYDEKHPTIVEPDTDKEPAEDDTSENEFQYQPIEGNLKAAVCYIGNEDRNPFDDMTEAEKENFLATSY